jgi:hypothetical protein
VDLNFLDFQADVENSDRGQGDQFTALRSGRLRLADLRDLLIQHYDHVAAATTRALVPLNQLYLPVD